MHRVDALDLQVDISSCCKLQQSLLKTTQLQCDQG